MASTAITGNDLANAALLASAAYSNTPGATLVADAASSNIQASWDLLAYAQLSPYNASLTASQFSQGLFSNGNGEAFVAVEGDTLAIAFRGSQELSDFLTDLNGGLGSQSFQPHYALFRNLIDAALAYADDGRNHISRVLVTGHSLGGAIVESVLRDHPDGNIIGITFGSPGDSTVPNGADPRLLNIRHTGDPVVDAVFGDGQFGLDVNVVRPYSADILTIPGLLAHMAFSSGDTGEHNSLLYERTAISMGLSPLWSQFWSAPNGYAVVVGTTGNDRGPDLSGSAAADFLLGDRGDDRIYGLGGNDLIDGGEGADEMRGGFGNDTYVVDSLQDTVIENAGEGVDTVQTALTSFTLAANVENLTFIGNANHVGSGNALNNVITGSAGADALTGGAGADTLSGGAPSTAIATFGAWRDWGTGVTPTDRVVDVNGDHMADLVQFGTNQVRVALSNGSGFGAWSPWATGITASDQVIDLDGDGNADMLQLYRGRAIVALSNGSGFGAWSDWTNGTTATDRAVDVNGDHRADLVQFGPNSVVIALSNGTGFGPWQQWATGITPNDQIVDLNGDGNADLLQVYQGRALVALSNGSGFGSWLDWTDGVTAGDRAVDINGDHRADLLQFGAENVYVALSTGTSFAPWSIGAGGITRNDSPVDVNGDGSADLVQFYQSRAIVALSTQPGSGNDVLTGGADADLFQFVSCFGRDEVTDFQPGTDAIQLDRAMFRNFADVLAHTANDGHGNSIISFDANNTILLDGIARANLSSSDFLFV